MSLFRSAAHVFHGAEHAGNKPGPELRVSRVIRLGEQINCERAVASERKVPLIVEEGARAGT